MHPNRRKGITICMIDDKIRISQLHRSRPVWAVYFVIALYHPPLIRGSACISQAPEVKVAHVSVSVTEPFVMLYGGWISPLRDIRRIPSPNPLPKNVKHNDFLPNGHRSSYAESALAISCRFRFFAEHIHDAFGPLVSMDQPYAAT